MTWKVSTSASPDLRHPRVCLLSSAGFPFILSACGVCISVYCWIIFLEMGADCDWSGGAWAGPRYRGATEQTMLMV